MSEDIYQLYLDEIEVIPPCDQVENASLAVSLSQGDEMAKKRLVEGNLKAAMFYTKDYLNRGITVNDLIQEANMALMLAVDSYQNLAAARMKETGTNSQEAHLPEGMLEQYLEQKIREALDAAVKAQDEESKVEEMVLARVNMLKDISRTMAEELGRMATVEEMAERLQMPVEEVRDLMKLTMDAMTLNGEYEE